jgi:predicted neuraminidase
LSDHKPRTAPRVPLSVALSDDNGEHWASVRDLERGDGAASADQHFPKRTGGEEFSYPSILQLPDGRILVAYTWRRKAIKAALLPEARVREGSTTGEFRPSER